MIRHVISWKLAATDPAAQDADFAKIADAFGELVHIIPEIKALWIGKDLGETEGNWDVVLIVDYANSDDLEIYQQHPDHLAVKKLVGPLVTARSAVDFEL